MPVPRILVCAAFSLALVASSASAADFGYGEPPPYDDYAGDGGPVPPARVYDCEVGDPNCDDGAYPAPDYRHRQYQSDDSYFTGDFAGDYVPPSQGASRRCFSRASIEKQLSKQGWRRFEDRDLRPDEYMLTASRPNGLKYRMRIDRCSGVIISANLLDLPDRRTVTSDTFDQPSY